MNRGDMMKVATCNQMKEIDRTAIEIGIQGIVLMENAAMKVVEEINRTLIDIQEKSILIFCGKGNNGGDGFAIARHLFNMGANVLVILIGDRSKVHGDANINLTIIEKLGLKIVHIKNNSPLAEIAASLYLCDLIVDAIYGTGIKGTINGIAKDIIELINHSGKQVISVDVPSGINGDYGYNSDICIKADKTITFALPKIGLLEYPAVNYVGELKVVDISIPHSIIQAQNININTIDEKYIKKILPIRVNDSNKGDYGKVFIIAGSTGLTGAAVLAASAALRSGSGLITVGIPKSLSAIMEVKLTEVMSVPLEDEKKGVLSLKCVSQIIEKLNKIDVLVFGPGLSYNAVILAILTDILKQSDVPIIIDADGINALAQNINVLEEKKCPVIITPHPGEMSRLTGLSIQKIQTNRIKVAQDFARQWKVTVVLKGTRTIVAFPNGDVFINCTGNAGMATGGMGDVLSGIIASLIGQGMNPEDAAVAGVYLHGMAGDVCSENIGQHGLIPTDVIQMLPIVFRQIYDESVQRRT